MPREISQGIDPIEAIYDITRDTFIFNDGNTRYEWRSADLPFTVFHTHNGQSGAWVDRELVRKYGAKAGA